jgi:hypothetical protein
MSKSQEAFEAAYPGYDHRLGIDGKYHSRSSQDAYIYFSKGLAYGRKQALEEAIAICEDTPYRGDSYMEGVASCEERIKELIK